MSIAFDATSNNSASSSGNVTWSHTCSGVNRYLLVYVVAGSGTPTATYNGTSMTLIDSNAGVIGYLFGLANPSSGVNTVSISSGVSILGGIALSYTGVAQTSSVDVFGNVSSNVTSQTKSLTSTVDKDWMIALGSSPSAGMSAGASTTQRANPAFTGGTPTAMYGCDSNADKTPTGTYSLTMNTSNSSNTTMFAVMLKLAVTNFPLTLAQASFTLTGNDTLFFKGLAYSLSLVQASFSLTGQAMSFILNLYTRVTNRIKHTTTVTNMSKNAVSSVTNRVKHISNVTNRPKS